MQQLCRIAATMAQTVPLTFDGDSDEQTARSGLWRFAAPEYYALALAISIGIATYIFVTGDAPRERLLTPALVAAIMVATLVPALALLLLTRSPLTAARPARLRRGGSGDRPSGLSGKG